MADSGILTRRVWFQRLLGATWLGNASLEEYAVGWWFQQHHVTYIYQSRFGGWINDLHTDFQVLGTAPPLCVEVQGDKWHAGAEQVEADRERIILLEQQGAFVVQVWGGQIMQYPGHAPPTDASFDRVMQEALNYIETPYTP